MFYVGWFRARGAAAARAVLRSCEGASRAGAPPRQVGSSQGGREGEVLAPRSGPKLYYSLWPNTGIASARSTIAQRPRVAGV